MKRVVSMLAALALALCMGTGAWGDGTVTYEGDAQRFIFAPGTRQSPTSLFENFQDMMPGDARTETIELRNSRRSGVDVRVYMRSLGAQEGTDAFLSQLTLSVCAGEENERFEAPADEAAGLGDWVYLGTVHPGGHVPLEVTVTMPLELGNEWQHQIGYIDWQFKIEQLPAADASPQTGDGGHALLWAAAAALALTALAALRRRGGKTE